MRIIKSYCVIIILNLIVQWSFAQSVEVCSSCEYKNINEAIGAVSNHDTIVIKKGTYNEYDIKVNKPLTIIGQDYPIIDGQNKGEIFTITADDGQAANTKMITSYARAPFDDRQRHT